MVVLNFNPGTQEADAMRSLWVRGQSGLQGEFIQDRLQTLYREILSQNQTNKHKNKEKERYTSQFGVLAQAEDSKIRKDGQL